MEIAKVVLIGIVLVFVILLLLTFILMLFPKVLGVRSKEKDPGVPQKGAPGSEPSARMTNQNEDGEGALVSVLTAAVAAYRADAEGDAAQSGFQVVAFRKTPVRGAGKQNKEEL